MHASRQRLSFPHGPVQPQTTLFLSTSPLHSNKLHFFPSSKTFTSVARIGQRLTDKPEANFGFILLPLSIRARLLLQVRDFTKLQQRRQRERLRLRLSGGKLSLSVVEGSLTRYTQATMDEPCFHTHFVTKRCKQFTLERKRSARLEGRPALSSHSSRQVFCGRVTPLAEPTPFSSLEPVAFFFCHGLGHQHSRRFIVLGHYYSRRDVM